VSESLVQKDIASGRVTLQHDAPLIQRLLAHARLLQLDAAPQRQLDQYAASEATGNAVVPEGGVALAVLQAEQQNLLHQREPGLLGVGVILLIALLLVLVVAAVVIVAPVGRLDRGHLALLETL